MGAVLYPVAANAEQALSAPLGRAAREREAEALAGTAVTFVTEPAGPAFADRDAALDAWKGRLDDDRPSRVSSVPPEDRYLELRELVAAEEKAQRPQKPLMKNGRRWPQPRPAPRVVWRLSISYWRLGDAPMAVAQQPRELRRRQKGDTGSAAAHGRIPAARRETSATARHRVVRSTPAGKSRPAHSRRVRLANRRGSPI